jgi:hypothetical protein
MWRNYGEKKQLIYSNNYKTTNRNRYVSSQCLYGPVINNNNKTIKIYKAIVSKCKNKIIETY